MQQILLEKKERKQRNFKTIEEKFAECSDPRKTKMTIEFNDAESASVKSFAVKKKKKNVIKATTRLLMFAKLSQKFHIFFDRITQFL